jgi:hypothetical protein
MRPAKVLLLLAGLAAFSFGGCRRGLCSSRSKPALTWTAIPADQVEVTPLEHATSFAVKVPPGAAPARRIELRFPRSLEAAKVEALGSGPHHRLTPLHATRVRGNTLAFDTPPLTLDRLDVVVHHHLRPPPLPPEVRVGKEVRP